MYSAERIHYYTTSGLHHCPVHRSIVEDPHPEPSTLPCPFPPTVASSTNPLRYNDMLFNPPTWIKIPQRRYECKGQRQFTYAPTSPIIFKVDHHPPSCGVVKTTPDNGAFEVKRLRLYAADDKSMVMKVRR